MTSPKVSTAAPEVWGGVECTVNRVGDTYRDQLELTGHAHRLSDLDRIAELGIRTVRYPVLWERIEREPGRYDWSWADERLGRLQQLGIEPIVGLIHHGSGPPWTNLLDDAFASRLADFADRVAARYPWVRRYTVVNEPLTTARFSALYGLWFPHACDDRAFVRALINQCRAIVLGMGAIRARRSDAALLQTEDISTTRSGDGVGHQAQFYDHRSWLSLDLLFGRVDARHPLRRYLESSGMVDADFDFFAGAAHTPDLIGINYYVASDRYLDQDLDAYPVHRHHHSLNGSFVDVAAARAATGIAGHLFHLERTWKRYQRPMAISEVHIDCTGEEQMRWFVEAWEATGAARRIGIPAEAVTAWALFGSVDWNSLLTATVGYYECGAYDVRGGSVRRRALATVVADAAAGNSAAHPASVGPGWWRRNASTTAGPDQRPLVVLGRGTLGRALAATCDTRGLCHRLLGRREIDICDAFAVAQMMDALKPWAVINACGFVRVDDAEQDHERCWRENVTGPTALAAAAAQRQMGYATFSSDLVFNGRIDRPYVEDDQPDPLSVYGRSKAAAEDAVLTVYPNALVIRTAAFFGPHDQSNFVTGTLRELLAGREVSAHTDLVISPTYVPDLAHATLELLIDRESGYWHLANAGYMTWWELARAAAQRFDASVTRLRPSSIAVSPPIAPRPQFSALASLRGGLMPSIESALDRYAHELDRTVLIAT